jgi:hypothetical protein
VHSALQINTRPVVVRHSVHINRPIEAVSWALANAPPGWLPSLVGPSQVGDGQAIPGIGLRAKVTVELGEPVTSGAWTDIPLTWQASYITRLFPLMVGKIEIAPNEGRLTTLTVYGSYEPPPERVGSHLDEDLTRRVAQSNVEELAESIARRLDAAAASY